MGANDEQHQSQTYLDLYLDKVERESTMSSPVRSAEMCIPHGIQVGLEQRRNDMGEDFEGSIPCYFCQRRVYNMWFLGNTLFIHISV